MAARDAELRPDYLIPKPFDPRLILRIAPAVAKAAMDSAAWRRGRSPTWTPTAKLQQLRLPSGTR
jgi:malic enzyme